MTEINVVAKKSSYNMLFNLSGVPSWGVDTQISEKKPWGENEWKGGVGNNMKVWSKSYPMIYNMVGLKKLQKCPSEGMDTFQRTESFWEVFKKVSYKELR